MKVAVAGAKGLAGSLMTAALIGIAESQGIERIVLYDRLGVPEEFRKPGLVHIVASEEMFCHSGADIYYLALHPGPSRDKYLNALIPLGTNILSEKPMSNAGRPGRCEQLIAEAVNRKTNILYNWILIPHKITDMILGYLTSFDDVAIKIFEASFQKNRESRHDERNACIMETVELQEAGHPIALFLYLMAKVSGKQVTFPSLFPDGVSVRARAKPYDPLNREDYPHVVNGYTQGDIATPDTTINLRVNFKRFDGFKPTLPEKKVRIEGTIDGKIFTIEANYQIGDEYLAINGEQQQLGRVSLYEDVWVRTLQNALGIIYFEGSG